MARDPVRAPRRSPAQAGRETQGSAEGLRFLRSPGPDAEARRRHLGAHRRPTGTHVDTIDLLPAAPPPFASSAVTGRPMGVPGVRARPSPSAARPSAGAPAGGAAPPLRQDLILQMVCKPAVSSSPDAHECYVSPGDEAETATGARTWASGEGPRRSPRARTSPPMAYRSTSKGDRELWARDRDDSDPAGAALDEESTAAAVTVCGITSCVPASRPARSADSGALRSSYAVCGGARHRRVGGTDPDLSGPAGDRRRNRFPP